jgi:hypothetical protein
VNCQPAEVVDEVRIVQQDIEITRWSGLWRNGSEVRVGVRLSDGRDALLVGFLARDAGDSKVQYSLVIQGQDHDSDFIIPAELEQRVEEKLLGDGRPAGSRTLKGLKLF